MPVETQSSSLATLAILKVNYDRRHSYIDTFLPFALDCLSESDFLSVEAIQKSVLSRYRLRIPINSLSTILRRASRKGLVKREHNHYSYYGQDLDLTNNGPLINAALREQSELVEGLIDYCSINQDTKLSRSDAEDALFAFMLYRDIDLLRSTISGSPFQHNGKASKKTSYLIGQFVKYISESNEALFKLMSSFVKAYVLSELLIFEHVGDLEKPFRQVDFYLDTQFTLRVLGFTNPLLARAAHELIDLLYKEGANLFIFEHTYQEMLGILTACERSMSKPDFYWQTEVSRYCIQNRVTPSDLRLEIAALKTRLSAHNVVIKPAPARNGKHEIGEKELVDYLDQNYKYRSAEARDKDVESISAIYRLRRGRKPNSLRNCEAVFVTTNANLTQHAYKFLHGEEDYTYFPLLITDHLATNLLWARNPDKYDNISKKQLLADALVLLNPSHEVWEKYCDEIEKLRFEKRLPDDEAALLLLSSEVQTTIMEVTAGGENEPNEDNIFDIITRARKRITNEERLEIEHLREQMHRMKEHVLEEKTKDGEINKLRQGLAIRDKAYHKTITTVENRLRKTAKVLSWFITIFLAAAVVVGAFNVAPPSFQYLVTAIVAVLTIANLFVGTTLVRLRRRLETLFYDKLSRSFFETD